MVKSRRELAIFLSKLKVFEKANVRLEQYPSDSEVAAILLWQAAMRDDVEDRDIIDLGCGTGILGIGALILGAKHVSFIDIDPHVEEILKENIQMTLDNWEIDLEGKWDFTRQDIREVAKDNTLSKHAQDSDKVVITNPPFGTKIKHADKFFLTAGKKLSNTIYSMHKTTTDVFVKAFARDKELEVVWQEDTSFPIKKTMPDHKKKIERIAVSLYCLKKED